MTTDNRPADDRPADKQPVDDRPADGRPVVVIAEALAASTLEIFGDEVLVRHVDGTDRPALLAAVADADGLLVRSATRVDAEVFAAASALKVVARAGVGLDNVDVAAATASGVMVVNAPTSNIVSAAEHAIGLLLAVARRVPAADASLRAGQWKRSAFSGVELAGKTIGVLGLGRIGQLVAKRLAAFDATLVAYDPYVSLGRAAQLGVRLVDLDELLASADAITVHLPKTAETKGLIGATELAKTKPGVLIVNAARGGLIDEHALADAVAAGQVGGAGIDVFEVEPTTASPLFELPRVVVTPHLGASTVEAQDRAGTEVARSVLLALRGEFVPDAVNVPGGGAVGEEVRPFLPLTQKLGTLAATLSQRPPTAVTVEVRGELSAEDVNVLTLAALRGVFSSATDAWQAATTTTPRGQVTFVNALRLADEFGVGVELAVTAESTDHRSLVTVRAVQSNGATVSVSGTVTGQQRVAKLVEVNGRHFDLRAEGTVLVLEYVDRPGVMGMVGTLLGEAGVNIEAAQISQTTDRSEAVMLMRVDRPAAGTVLDAVGAAVGAHLVRAVTFR